MNACKFYKSGNETECGSNLKDISEKQAIKIIKTFCQGKHTTCNYYKKQEGLKMNNNQIIPVEEAELTIYERSVAVAVHERIFATAKVAASALADMAKSLKQMRDEELYKELGFNSFGEYVEKNGDYSFKERQAYTYIKAYEELGSSFLQSNAELGITKLELLTKIPSYERQDFIENNEVTEKSVKELEELIKANQQLGEQVSFLTGEAESVKTNAEKYKSEAAHQLQENQKLADRLNNLNAKIKELEEKPIDVAVAEPSTEDIEKIKDKAKKQAEKEFKKKLDAEKADFEKRLAESQNLLQSEKQALEKKLKSSSAEESKVAFKFYFTEMQNNIANFIAALSHIADTEIQNKYKAVVVKYLNQIVKELSE